MTFATLILDALYGGLLLIAAGWFSDLVHSRQRRQAARLRASAPFGIPHLHRASAADRDWSRWGR
jgi:hypothetical protein